MATSQFPTYLEFLSESKVMMCHSHHHCFTLNDLGRHVEKEHNASRQLSRQIEDAARNLEVAEFRSRIIVPPNNSPHIDGLAVYEGFRCTMPSCDFVTISEPYFRKHLQDHGLPRSYKIEAKNEVQLQNMHNAKAPLYFIVHPKLPPGPEVRSRPPHEQDPTTSPSEQRGSVKDNQGRAVDSDQDQEETADPEENDDDEDEDEEQDEEQDEEEEEVEDVPAHATRSSRSQMGRIGPSPTFLRNSRVEVSPRSSRRAPSQRRSRNTRPNSPSSAPARRAVSRARGRNIRIDPSPPPQRRARSRPTIRSAHPSPSPPPSRPAKRRMTESSFLEPFSYEPSFAEMMFRTERKDTGHVFLCVASDLMTVDTRKLEPSPMNVDFNRYRRFLEEEDIMDEGIKLYFIDDTGKRVQVSNQVSFRAGVMCQVAQGVDRITFSSEPSSRYSISSMMPRALEVAPEPPAPVPSFLPAPSPVPVEAPVTAPVLVPSTAHISNSAPAPAPAPVSATAPAPAPAPTITPVSPHVPSLRPAPTSQESGPLFSNTVFLTERLNTEQNHICLAANIKSSSSDLLTMQPTDVDFDSYCELLREAEVLDSGLVLGFLDSRLMRIQVKNQASFVAGIVYQVSRKVDMIRFSSVPIVKPPQPSTNHPPAPPTPPATTSAAIPAATPAVAPAATTPAAAPISAVIATPVAARAAAPVTSPVDAPVVDPVAVPVAAPIATPIVAPVAAPIIAPVAAPIVAPVAPPIASPVAGPVAVPIAPLARSQQLPFLNQSLRSTRQLSAPAQSSTLNLSKVMERAAGHTEDLPARSPMPAPSLQQAAPPSPKPVNAGVRSRKSSISEDDRPLAARPRPSQPASSSLTSSNRTPSNLTSSSRAYPNLTPSTQKPMSQPASRQSSTNPTSNQKHASPLPPTDKERLPSSSAKNSPIPHFLPDRPDRNTPFRRSSNSSSAEDKKREGAESRATNVGKGNEVEPAGQRVPARNGRGVSSSVRVPETGPGVARPPAKNIREFQLGRVSQPTANGPGAAAANGRKRRHGE